MQAGNREYEQGAKMDIQQELDHANRCLQRKDLTGALRTVQAILEKTPHDIAALNLLGIIHGSRGNHGEAIRALSQAVISAPRDIRLHFNLGRNFSSLGDFQSATKAFERTVRLDPDNAAAWAQLVRLYQIFDDHEKSLAACRQVLRLAPTKSTFPVLRYHALVGVGIAETANGNYKAAAEALTVAIAENPDAGNAYAHLGKVCRDQGKTDEAVENYLKAAQFQPEQPGQIVNAAITLLRAGQLDEADDLLEDCLERFPGDRSALGVYGALLWEMGRDDEYHRLCDFDAFVCPCSIDTAPGGYDSVKSFLAALIAETKNQPALSYGATAKATRGGIQTENVFVDPPPATGHLRRIVRDKILKFIEDDRHTPHPLWSPWVKDWDMVGWGVILSSQGHQSPHNHPQSMVSGVCYLQVPEEAHEDGDGPGCIEFGPPYEGYGAQREPFIRRYPAVEGRIYLFPSQFLHRTVPFESRTERICIAFDSIPRPSGPQPSGP